jgi:hypothetical protein
MSCNQKVPGILSTMKCMCKFYARLSNAVRRKRRDKWQGQRFLHHDNAPSHTSLVVQQFLAEKNIPVITQPPYLSGPRSSDFWLFRIPKMVVI